MIRGAGRLRKDDRPACCAVGPRGYVCTLDPGHVGKHVASSSFGPDIAPLDSWPQARPDLVRDGRHLMVQHVGYGIGCTTSNEGIGGWLSADLNSLDRTLAVLEEIISTRCANASRDALDRHRAAFGVPFLRPGALAHEVIAAYASVDHEVARMEDEGGSPC